MAARRRAGFTLKIAFSTTPARESIVAVTKSTASRERSKLLTLNSDISQLPSPRNRAMAGWSAGYQAARVRRQLTRGPISSLPGTAGLPPFISFSTSYPELNSAVLRHTDNERYSYFHFRRPIPKHNGRSPKSGASLGCGVLPRKDPIGASTNHSLIHRDVKEMRNAIRYSRQGKFKQHRALLRRPWLGQTGRANTRIPAERCFLGEASTCPPACGL